MSKTSLFPNIDSAPVLAGYISWALCSALAVTPYLGLSFDPPIAPGICRMERWGGFYTYGIAVPVIMLFAFAAEVVLRIRRISSLRGKTGWGVVSLALLLPAAVGLSAASSLVFVNCGGRDWGAMTMSDAVGFYWSHAIAAILPQIEAVYGGQDQMAPNIAKIHAVLLRLFLSVTVVWILAEIVTSVRRSYLQEPEAEDARGS